MYKRLTPYFVLTMYVLLDDKQQSINESLRNQVEIKTKGTLS